MRLLYDLGIRTFSLALRVAALMSGKARLLAQGRASSVREFSVLACGGSAVGCGSASSATGDVSAVGGGRRYWFHCASLGEFEQGRPVIEALRAAEPQALIYLTFFSPSGFEVRKEYDVVDGVYYLPADTARNARLVMDAFRADVVVFVKYEFWYHFLSEARVRGAKCYVVAAIFRPDMVFFKPWGSFFRKILGNFERLFVQNEESRELLMGIGVEQDRVVVCGDTRFDRVVAVVDAVADRSSAGVQSVTARRLAVVERFCGGHSVLVAGSTWGGDQELLVRLVAESGMFGDDNGAGWRMVMVPHEIHDAQIEALAAGLPQGWVVRLSELAVGDTSVLEGDSGARLDAARILVVDCVGLLSRLYGFARIGYVGGGFGVGIHNILEAATWGVPVVFGPKYHKFREAVELVKLSGAYSVKDYEELDVIFRRLTGDGVAEKCGQVARNYVRSNVGATDCIMKEILGV